jgi:hypothetical protein
MYKVYVGTIRSHPAEEANPILANTEHLGCMANLPPECIVTQFKGGTVNIVSMGSERERNVTDTSSYPGAGGCAGGERCMNPVNVHLVQAPSRGECFGCPYQYTDMRIRV